MIENIVENEKYAVYIYLELLLHFLPLAIIEDSQGQG